MIEAIHIYDLDGTVIDSAHRYRNLPNGSIDLDFWIANSTPENIAKDSLLPLAAQYKQDLKNPSIYVVVATARQCAASDYAFIRDKLGMPDHFISRKAGDTRADSVLKVKALRRLLSLRQFAGKVAHFWDDNPLNVQAVSALGVTAILV